MVRKSVTIVWHEGGEGHSITAEIHQGRQLVAMFTGEPQGADERELALLAELFHAGAFPVLFE
jgi:hypothetical protein